MDDKAFWKIMELYNKIVEKSIKNKKGAHSLEAITFIYHIPINKRKLFIKKYKKIYDRVYKIIFSPKIFDNSGRSVSVYHIGADDSHWDFVRYLIRSGEHNVGTFFKNPKSPAIIELSKKLNSEGSAIDCFNSKGEYECSYMHPKDEQEIIKRL